jgi:DNA-binding GntR family transcriptional regulator
VPDDRAPSARAYEQLSGAVLNGEFRPGEALKPQQLATRLDVSLAVVRESLLRMVGEGLAERLPNRGFAVPAVSGRRWRQVAEAQATVEPAMLRMAIARGDLDWEARVRAAHHRLAGTPTHEPDGRRISSAWSDAHHRFHRTLLEACDNPVLLEAFERMWTASELARRWSVSGDPSRDAGAEHLALEEAALARDADRAADLLCRHVLRTAEALRS